MQLQGADVGALREAASRVKADLARYPGVIDIADSFREGKQEVKLAIKPTAEPLGVTLRDLARQVRQAFYGEEAQRIQRGRDDIRVMVRYPEEERRSLGDLENVRIRTLDGAEVPFGTVADAELGRGFATIQRTDRMRVVNVTANVDRTLTTANDVLADLQAASLPQILADYPSVSYSLEGEQREQRRAFSGLLERLRPRAADDLRAAGGAAPLLYPAAGHHERDSLRAGGRDRRPHPDAVARSAPRAQLLLRGRDRRGLRRGGEREPGARLQRERAAGSRGIRWRRPCVAAGVARFRPIVLTSLTTFAGLTPLMLERSLQAQFLIPMAVSLAFGVMFATVITLLVLPCGYLVLEDLRGASRRARPARSAPNQKGLEETSAIR